MEREISIILKVKGAAQAKKAVEDVFNQQTTTLVKGFNQATAKTGTNMQRVAKTSKQASTGVQSFTKTLGRSLSMMYLYNRAWATFGSQFEEGLQLERASDQFERNVGSVTKMLPELRTATRGVVSDFDLLRVAGRAVQQGIKSTNLPQTFKLATVAAQKLNMSATDAISTITQALTRQDEGALNSLGIITNVNQAYKTQAALIAKNGGVMSQAMSIQLRQSLIMKELQKRFGGANQAQADGLQVLERFRASWKNFRAEIGQTLGIALLPLTRALTTVLDLTTKLLDRLNNTSGFRTFIQLSATLAGIFAGVKFIGGIRTFMGLLGLTGSKKSLTGIVKSNSVFKILATTLSFVTKKIKTFVVALSFVSPKLAQALSGVPGWGLALTTVLTLLGPIANGLKRAWQMGKVFFQLLSNFDENSGMSKVLKEDANALGDYYNFVESMAKGALEIWAVLKGLGQGISDAFRPLGQVLSWASDKFEDLTGSMFKWDKSAVKSQSRLDAITEKVKKYTKWLGLAVSLMTMFIPGFQFIGATGVAAFGGSLINDTGWADKLTGMFGSQTQATPTSSPVSQPQTQMSTQVSSPEPRAMNLDYANDSSELLRKMSKQLEAQTGIMETDAQKQDIRESQNAARSNILQRR